MSVVVLLVCIRQTLLSDLVSHVCVPSLGHVNFHEAGRVEILALSHSLSLTLSLSHSLALSLSHSLSLSLFPPIPRQSRGNQENFLPSPTFHPYYQTTPIVPPLFFYTEDISNVPFLPLRAVSPTTARGRSPLFRRARYPSLGNSESGSRLCNSRGGGKGPKIEVKGNSADPA